MSKDIFNELLRALTSEEPKILCEENILLTYLSWMDIFRILI